MMKAEAIIYNFSDDKNLDYFINELKNYIEIAKKSNLIVDEIIIKFQDEPNGFQSDPKEGNL